MDETRANIMSPGILAVGEETFQTVNGLFVWSDAEAEQLFHRAAGRFIGKRGFKDKRIMYRLLDEYVRENGNLVFDHDPDYPEDDYLWELPANPVVVEVTKDAVLGFITQAESV